MGVKLRAWLLFLIFLTGFLSLSLELIVIRQLAFYVGSSAVVTSIIIGAFLGFMSIGYFRGSSIKPNRYNVRKILFASFITIAAMSVLAGSFALITGYFYTMYAAGIFSIVTQTALFSLIFLSVAPFLFGFNVALLSRYLHKHDINYTGKIMAWDTIGSVLGSLATTLILMPIIGVNYTILLIIIMALGAAFAVMPRLFVVPIIAVIFIPAVVINTDSYLRRAYGIIINNENSTISVEEYGDGTRILKMNGVNMSIYNKSAGTTAQYVDYINDNFIYNMPRDKRRNILVLGAGGFTAGLRDTFNAYTFIDIERTLKDVSEQKFLGEKLTENKKFIVQDASQFLKNTMLNYDLIILDVYSNSYQVPENLITMEFMQRIKSRVAPGGMIVMNVIASPDFNDKFSRVFDNTFRAVFPNNTTRQVIGHINPWVADKGVGSNVLYIYYNRPESGRIYTINKTPVIYDR
ncbi:MAG: fused MFS/spermidine synthase [Alphaproteobacteria bacterium]|nr:fused MFS/spermidine synthase [Alphaproteobacteria bacterium]MCL2890132.1 fused MFS/spermidine synthase [Alphaproteobacteria bacterium]